MSAQQPTEAEGRLAVKLQNGRPVDLTPAEQTLLRENLRRAMAVTLERPEAEIKEDALIFDQLGLDSIDVFDLLDQLAEHFDVPIEPDDFPEEMIFGKEGMTFRDFSDGILRFFQSPPENPRV